MRLSDIKAVGGVMLLCKSEEQKKEVTVALEAAGGGAVMYMGDYSHIYVFKDGNFCDDGGTGYLRPFFLVPAQNFLNSSKKCI